MQNYLLNPLANDTHGRWASLELFTLAKWRVNVGRRPNAEHNTRRAIWTSQSQSRSLVQVFKVEFKMQNSILSRNSLTDTGYTCLGVMRPERSLDDDFHYQELDVQWRDNFLWVQTKFSRNCQIYAFPIDANGSMRKQVCT